MKVFVNKIIWLHTECADYEAQLPLPNQSSRNMVTDCKTSTSSDEDKKGKTSTNIDDEKK